MSRISRPVHNYDYIGKMAALTSIVFTHKIDLVPGKIFVGVWERFEGRVNCCAGRVYLPHLPDLLSSYK